MAGQITTAKVVAMHSAPCESSPQLAYATLATSVSPSHSQNGDAPWRRPEISFLQVMIRTHALNADPAVALKTGMP